MTFENELSMPPGAEHIFCNLCGADDTVELYTRADYRFEVDNYEWPLVRCRRCGMVYLNPRPNPDAIWRYYPTRFFERRELEHLSARYEAQAEYLAGITPGTLLDIGCANGDWIRIMRDRGWTVSGLEPSASASNPSGLNIRASTVESADYPPESFDVITAWAVFEHLHDPLRALFHVEKWLRPGGRFIMLVPNIRSISSRFGYQEDIPRHLHIFSERTVEQYARKVGLHLTRVQHDTAMLGGSGRGALRVRLLEMIGVHRGQYFRAMRLPFASRLRRHPGVALIGASIGILERAVLSDWLARQLRLSGTIVAVMNKSTR